MFAQPRPRLCLYGWLIPTLCLRQRNVCVCMACIPIRQHYYVSYLFLYNNMRQLDIHVRLPNLLAEPSILLRVRIKIVYLYFSLRRELILDFWAAVVYSALIIFGPERVLSIF